jgi:glycosyltransferase involved in cell wall biosynthesis
MACAKPVIGARVGGLQEIIDNSQTGLLVEPDNIEQLRAAIIQVLQQEEWAKRLGQNAHLKVKSAFSWSGVARKTEALYKGLLPADET